MGFAAYETAELMVGGRILKDWETVMVRRDYTHLPTYFIFSTSEATSRNSSVLVPQIMPGDEAVIKLGGKTALRGYVNARQTGYDKDRHGVQIQGAGKTQDVVRGSMELKKVGLPNKGGQYLDQDFQAIADDVLKPFGFRLKIIGGSENLKFKDEAVMPGEPPFSFLARLARSRGYLLGESQEEGELIALAQPSNSGGELIEGRNIIDCRATISDTSLTNPTVALGQQKGSDKEHADKAAQITADGKGAAKRYRPFVGVAPGPQNMQDLKKFVDMESGWRAAVTIEATITVQGWLTGGKSGDLWREGDFVKVQSPMAALNQKLWIKAVTFTQDSEAGTRTQLELLRNATQGAVAL
jgi:prophage tail gpP-like protein